ncbi:MAG TPA: alanine racemase [Maritimibacter sp.]|nr:alanine racemase [Maritimibacter sp.]
MSSSALPSWCKIHLDRISSNLARALDLLPSGSAFCAVLKADAYGHGIDRVVPLVREQNVSTVGITSNHEAYAVRKAGFEGRVIRLRAATQDEVEGALESCVEEQVACRDTARHMRALLDTGRLKAPVHLSLNAGGMARDGLELGSDVGKDTSRAVLASLGQNVRGICSHYPSNEPTDLQRNAALFQEQVDWVLKNSDLSRSDVLVHAGSSLTLVSETKVETDMYRCGAILYGILKPEWGFVPTMDLEARVVSLQDYPSGASVGYDCETQLTRGSRLACVSIGYQNGFRRYAVGRSQVAIRDRLVPVVGKVSMNAIIADVTDSPDVQVGDTVGVFGGGNVASITPATAERQFATIMADLCTDWGMRNPRVYT